MNFKHGIGLSWVHESTDVETKRPCARLRDADRESFAVSASGDPAMVLMFRMASILPMVRASYPLRPAAGLLLDTLAYDPGFPDHAKTRARCARELVLNGECYAFQAAPCNAPRPCA